MARLCGLFLLLSGGLWAADAYPDRWREVADHLIQTPVESYPFNWGEGVQQIGLMKVYERTKDPRYLGYMEKWAAQFAPGDVELLLKMGAKAIGTKPGYCGHWSPATAILYLHQARPRAEYLQLAQQVADFIRKQAERSPEGGLGHWQGSHQLWVDTLYMACPLLSGLGYMEKRDSDIADAAQQIVIYSRRLQDEKTGLFYHMWDWQTGERTPGPWGRGNGWVLMSLADTLEVMNRSHQAYAPLRSIAGRLAAGLRATQDSEGMWHTVLDDPASYPEASATSMFAYGLLKLVRLGVLDRSKAGMAQRAWGAVNEKFVKGGVVTGVSAGTEPKGSNYYKQLPLGNQTWGTGAYLMAGSEVDRLR